jgi:hypothetical protein
MLALATPRNPPNRCSRRARRLGPTPAISSSLLPAGAHARPRGPHAGDGKAVGLVADLRHQHQRRRILAQGTPSRGHLQTPVLPGRPCGPRLFPRPRSAPKSSPNSANTSRAMLTCPLPPSTSTRSGSGRACCALPAHRHHWPLGRFPPACCSACEDLAHGGIVVARRDAVDVVAPVFAALHLVLFETPRRMPASPRPPCGRCRNIRCERYPGHPAPGPGLHQRTGASLLRALFGQQPGQLQLGVLLGHFQPEPALLTRVVHRADAHPACAPRAASGLADRRAGDQRGRHRHANVVLGNESLQHLHFHRRQAQARRRLRPPAPAARLRPPHGPGNRAGHPGGGRRAPWPG